MALIQIFHGQENILESSKALSLALKLSRADISMSSLLFSLLFAFLSPPPSSPPKKNKKTPNKTLSQP